MKKEIEEISKKLLKEREFFEEYREKFSKQFIVFMKKNMSLNIPERSLRTLGDDIYSTLFIEFKDPETKLYNLSKKMYETKTEIKSVLTKLFMIMIKDFIDYLIENKVDINLLKTLINLIDMYIATIERAGMDYISSLENKLERIEKDSKKVAQEEILLLIEAAHDKITIIDYFYEVPVTCRGKLKYVKDGHAVFNVKNCIFKIYEVDHFVFLKIKNVSKTIKAVIKDIDYRFGTLVLTNFEFSEIPQEKRKFVRVRLKDKIIVTLQKDSETFEGFIDDISVGGIGVFTKSKWDLNPGDRLKISFMINDKDFDVTGEIKYITEVDGLFRLGIQFLDLSVKNEEILGEFVMKRQFEILKKLREL
ncbi:PilZ domain-containing protein [Persephonella sp.]